MKQFFLLSTANYMLLANINKTIKLFGFVASNEGVRVVELSIFLDEHVVG